MLHDKYLPDYHFSEKHRILIKRPPHEIYKLIDEFDFTDSVIIKILFRLRGMTTGMTLKTGLLRHNFIELERTQNQELLIGLAGQFWKPSGSLKKLTPTEFTAFDEPGFTKATWNFLLIPDTATSTILETETRIKCLDQHARKSFSRYWFFIRPFSGLIRMEMLRSVKKKAERKEVLS